MPPLLIIRNLQRLSTVALPAFLADNRLITLLPRRWALQMTIPQTIFGKTTHRMLHWCVSSNDYYKIAADTLSYARRCYWPYGTGKTLSS